MQIKKLDIFFIDVVKEALKKTYWKEWLRSKPTGKLTIEVNINQGGVQGVPKVTVTDN